MHEKDTTHLAESFRRYFALRPALDEHTRTETYRIRHGVYCEDLGWEAPRPDGLETDAYDSHSIPCLMRTAGNGASVGCLRLVLCKPDNPQQPLPLERACTSTLDRTLLDPAMLDRLRLAEVSRLAVTRDYRRRKGEADKPIAVDTSDFGDQRQQRFPFIPVGLYLAAFAMAEQLGIDQLLVLTEPRLARHLGRIGLDIRQIGGPIEHRGQRVPSVMDTRATINNLHPMLQRLWQEISGSVSEAFASHRQSQAFMQPAVAISDRSRWSNW